jgi:hypothetical protein
MLPPKQDKIEHANLRWLSENLRSIEGSVSLAEVEWYDGE